MKSKQNCGYEYSKELVDTLAFALQDAVESLPFDSRCIDWLSYNPDRYIKIERGVAASFM